MKAPKWNVWSGYSQQDWELALEEVGYQQTVLDYLIGALPYLGKLLWSAKAGAFCRGLEHGRKEKDNELA